MRHAHIALALCLLICQGSFSDAALLKRKSKAPDAAEKVRTYQPPPPQAMPEYCEPYRKRAFDLGQVPFWQKPFVIPQKNWAISKHRKCVDSLMQQEWEYLRHADLQKGPSLPKLRLEDEGKPSGNLPKEGAPNAAR